MNRLNTLSRPDLMGQTPDRLKVSEVAEQIGYIEATVTEIETGQSFLEQALKPGIRPAQEGAAGTDLPPPHPVPLVASLNSFVQRLRDIRDRQQSIIERIAL